MSHQEFIDKALEGERSRDPKHPSNRNKHVLQIESLRDGKAFCSCGGWFYSHTGPVVYEEIFEEFEKHIKLPEIEKINPDLIAERIQSLACLLQDK